MNIRNTVALCVAIMSLGIIAPLHASGRLDSQAGVLAITSFSRMERARAMTEAGNPSGTIDALSAVACEQIPLGSAEREEFIYLLGKAYFSTADARCLDALGNFVARYPASSAYQEAILLTGDFYFFASEWSKALEEYRRVDLKTLPADSRALYSYREGLCMLRRGFYKEARPLFNYVASRKNYSLAGKYYEGYLDYIENNNSGALEKFEYVAGVQNTEPQLAERQLRGEKLYPEFYMAQCYFRLGEWDKCIRMAKGILKRDNLPEPLLKIETMRVYGLSLYESGKRDAAQGVLESYVERAGESSTDDALYALGVCEYDAGLYEQASKNFSRLLSDRNVISQGSHLYLGLIEASSGNASGAAINFEKAYRMNFDNKVAESALYNYVAACSRGGAIPFESNVGILEKFIGLYPASNHTPDVERHLAWLFYQQGKYEEAVEAIDRLSKPSASDLLLKQKIYYSAGASALSRGNSREAVGLLRKAVGIKGGDPTLTAQSLIWLGDAYYREGDYKYAESSYEGALKSGRAGENTDLLRYDLGYAKFKLGKYQDALRCFRPIAESFSALTPEMRRDAALRMADCKYYSGHYESAKADYAILKESGGGSDHAAYRYARILGREGDMEGRIAELERFEREFGNSPLMAEVLRDLADAYTSADSPSKAAAAYSRYLRRNPTGDDSVSSLLGMARAYTEAGEPMKALEAYLELERRGDPDYMMEAYAGVMLTTSDPAQRSEYAGKIFGSGGAAPEIRDEAEMWLALDRLKSPSGAERATAVATLERLSKNPFSEAGARSAVTLAARLLESGDAAGAAQLMEEFTSSGTEEQYWLARGFIVLADACTAQGKKYLAQEYLKVLRENYPGKEEDIYEMIESRLVNN